MVVPFRACAWHGACGMVRQARARARRAAEDSEPRLCATNLELSGVCLKGR